MTNLYTLSRRIAAIAVAVLMFTGCMKDKLTKTYTISAPVFEKRSDVLARVGNKPSQAVGTPGKIYMFGKYLFLNELNQGVHIIDNSNPSSPQTVGFISIPGNVDIAVKGNVLYADMFSDLLTIDITDPTKVKVLSDIPRVFPERGLGQASPDSTLFVTGYEMRDTTISREVDPTRSSCWGCFFDNGSFASMAQSSASKASGVPGMGGSMARFAVVNDYMYTVGPSMLRTFSLVNQYQPEMKDSQVVGFDIETIYPFKDRLFVGSSASLFIYTISNPAKPNRESVFQHARACDPVVADDNFAFVTLRTGNLCGGTQNILDIVDVSNIASPKRVTMYPLTNPHGLSKDGGLLFICDGKDGLKMYDARVVTSLKLLHHVKGIETYDAIAWNNNVIVVATDGLHQYDYSDRTTMKHLSTIRISKKS